MGELSGKDSSVLIENVSLVINVFNIGHNGNITQSSIHGQPHRQTVEFIRNCIAEGTNTSLNGGGLIQESTGICNLAEGCVKLEEPYKDPPLGWIACVNGDVIPFGIQSTTLEVSKFGDTNAWKEIRVCLPASFLLADNETDLYCPVSSCLEKLPKNKSIDSHIKKHLGLASENTSVANQNATKEAKLPCPLFYYCHEKSCQYNVDSAEKRFKAYKNVKQHFMKVHAPKVYSCDTCEKTFSTLKTAETHALMCGEKYMCSSCNASYNSIEALQTHCRRKAHTFDHSKYKDKRNSVKQEKQCLKTAVVSPQSSSTGTTGKKQKTVRKPPLILPKVSSSSDPVLNTIQAFCKQAGVKVDYGCQTVCTAFLQKSNPVKAVIPSSPTTPTFTHKKRKSTDTQTNIVKFRATCLDQKHNATNTNVDWKKVVTSDSQTQTADLSDPAELSCPKGVGFNDEFANVIKISETSNTANPDTSDCKAHDDDVEYQTCKAEPPEKSDSVENSAKEDVADETSSSSVHVDNGPNLHSEFITFLEAADYATQTDPDMFETLGGDCLGIDVNLDSISNNENRKYVSVSSTASQTALESVSSKSLSAEDYEALLNATTIEDGKVTDVFSDYFKTLEGADGVASNTDDGFRTDPEPSDTGLFFDWENIVEEVYRDHKNSQL